MSDCETIVAMTATTQVSDAEGRTTAKEYHLADEVKYKDEVIAKTRSLISTE